MEAPGARVLEKSLDLLYSFESHHPEQSLFQISRNLRFPPSTVRRLLKVMSGGSPGRRRFSRVNAAFLRSCRVDATSSPSLRISNQRPAA
ncbi:MAG: helix-turn-helix domain-containing protein [Alphaproteobacteria bacterium]